MKVSFRELHRTVKLRLIIQFVGGLTSTMVMPFLAIYFSKMVGETLTGLMFVGVLLAGVAGGFLGGYYADKFGRKKVMIICESVSFLTYLLIAFFNSPWIEAPYVTAVLFVVNVFFGGMFGPAAQAMLLDVSDATSRKLIFTISYWLGNLAGGVGGILGGFWFEAYHFYLFLAVGAVSLVSVLATVFFISETKPKVEPVDVEKAMPTKKEKKKGGDSKYKSAFKDRPFLLYFIACLLLLTIEQQLPNYIGVRLSKELPDQAIFHSALWSLKVDGIKMLGILRTENTFLVVLMGALVSRLMKGFKDRWVLLLGAGIFTLGFTVLGFSNSPWLLLGVMFFATVGELMNVPIRQALLGDIAPEQARSTYLAINNLTYFGSGIIGGAFITLGALLTSSVISGVILGMGIVSSGLLFIVEPLVQKRVVKHVPTSQGPAVSIKG